MFPNVVGIQKHSPPSAQLHPSHSTARVHNVLVAAGEKRARPHLQAAQAPNMYRTVGANYLNTVVHAQFRSVGQAGPPGTGEITLFCPWEQVYGPLSFGGGCGLNSAHWGLPPAHW